MKNKAFSPDFKYYPPGPRRSYNDPSDFHPPAFSSVTALTENKIPQLILASTRSVKRKLTRFLKGSMNNEIVFREKRKVQQRILAKIPIRYWEMRDEETEILFQENLEVRVSYSMNVSLGGLFLVTKEELRVDGFVRLHLFLPSTPFLSLLAQVMWTDPQGAGLCFVGIKPREVAALKEYLTQISE